MNLDRRSVLKNLLIIAGGVTVIPSCMQEDGGKPSIKLTNLDITSDDEHMLAELSETIIPKTNTPGAKDTYTHLYILKMIDDCRTKEEQKKFESGLKEFKKLTYDTFKKSFMKLTTLKRLDFIKQIEEEKDVPGNVLAFYKIVKGLTIQGYMSSKFYLSKVQVYELTPGRFKGCTPIAEPSKVSK